MLHARARLVAAEQQRNFEAGTPPKAAAQVCSAAAAAAAGPAAHLRLRRNLLGRACSRPASIVRRWWACGRGRPEKIGGERVLPSQESPRALPARLATPAPGHSPASEPRGAPAALQGASRSGGRWCRRSAGGPGCALLSNMLSRCHRRLERGGAAERSGCGRGHLLCGPQNRPGGSCSLNWRSEQRDRARRGRRQGPRTHQSPQPPAARAGRGERACQCTSPTPWGRVQSLHSVNSCRQAS